MVKQLISEVQAGVCGEMDRTSIEEEYGVSYRSSDDDQSVRRAITLECLVWCLENGSERNSRWFLQNTLEVRIWYWPP